MNFKKTLRHTVLVLIFTFFAHQNSFSQCFEIESILVDACDGNTNTEGLNEMVRFKVGNANLNTSNMVVSWPNNPWGRLIQNSVTAGKVANLNADIIQDGGCGQLREPVGGVLPANATVILVTSYNFDVTSNSFGALTEDIYILFQNSNTTSGHFANFGTGTRTLRISFGSCSDTATYDRALLINQAGNNAAGDGATVNFSPSGTPTYINNGCIAPIPPFTVDAGPATLSVCTGNSVVLTASAQGQQTVAWSAPSGTFSAPNNLATAYTPSNASAGTVVTLTLTVTNSCGTQITDTINLTVTNGTVPNFNVTPLTICRGNAVPALNTTSPNGITGTWSPAIISNTTNGTYTFTPNTGQCASSVTLSVTITTSIVPNFSTQLTLCAGSTAPILSPTSPNGITGTWSPAVVSNTTNGNYTFTPNAGQCATSVTTQVNITTASIVPNFNVNPITICAGSTAPILSTTSPNGISGTWSPAIVSNTTNGTYTFTPNAGQCATPVTLQVTITAASTVPNFNVNPISICNGSTAPILNTTSPNGISGTWSPAIVSNTTNGTYTFTPNTGQCATPVTLQVTITAASTVPNFNVNPISICNGSTAPILNTTSPNGISGTWSPAIISNTANGTYTFTPNAGQCATSVSLSVTITSGITPDFTTSLSICNGNTPPLLNTISPNGISGTWSPATIDTSSNGSYTFTPNAGQCANSTTLSVTIASIQAKITENCIDGHFTLQVNPLSSSYNPNNVDYTWKNASGQTVGNNDESFDVFAYTSGLTNASYPMQFSVLVDDNGCQTTETFSVPNIACNIPKGISPNGDGSNDEFDLTGFNVRKLEIFNRYGTKVNSFSNYRKEWHGQSDSGNDLPDGTYYYVIERDGVKTVTGWVQINRQR